LVLSMGCRLLTAWIHLSSEDQLFVREDVTVPRAD